MDVHTRRGKREFFVKWKGFPKSKATWEPEDNLSCNELVEEFMAQREEVSAK